MAKAAAMLTILLSSTLLGCRMAGRLHKRLVTLKRLEVFFRTLLNRMQYQKAPLAELMKGMVQDDNRLLACFTGMVSSGMPPDKAWRTAVTIAIEEGGEFSCLTKRDSEIMERFLSTLGRSGIQSQQEYANMLFQEFGEAIQEAESNYTGKAKVYRSLGALGGAAMSILLL